MPSATKPVEKVKKPKIEITEVDYQDTQEEGYRHKSKFYIQNSLGNYVYFHCKDRLEAQKKCDDMYGKGWYTIRSSGTEKSGNISVRGSTNSKSRSGAYMKQINNSQGRGVG